MLDVKGKNFMVENGTVTFVGDDPSNPEIVVKAGWTAPDGTMVYATFDGPLKTGKVTLSSEPTLPQQEIVQLLLFGTADGKQAQTPSGSPEDSAIGTAGGEAAQPLNHALGQLGLGAVTANIDTTQSANPKPEVEVQIARDALRPARRRPRAAAARGEPGHRFCRSTGASSRSGRWRRRWETPGRRSSICSGKSATDPPAFRFDSIRLRATKSNPHAPAHRFPIVALVLVASVPLGWLTCGGGESRPAGESVLVRGLGVR